MEQNRTLNAGQGESAASIGDRAHAHGYRPIARSPLSETHSLRLHDHDQPLSWLWPVCAIVALLLGLSTPAHGKIDDAPFCTPLEIWGQCKNSGFH